MLLKQLAKAVAARLDPPPHGVRFAADYRRKFPNKQIRLIFDVGANVGQSVVEFQRDFPSAVILSFEPDKNSFDILQRINGRAYNLQSAALRDNCALTTDRQSRKFVPSPAIKVMKVCPSSQ